jgi:hypothetical protein
MGSLDRRQSAIEQYQTVEQASEWVRRIRNSAWHRKTPVGSNQEGHGGHAGRRYFIKVLRKAQGGVTIGLLVLLIAGSGRAVGNGDSGGHPMPARILFSPIGGMLSSWAS